MKKTKISFELTTFESLEDLNKVDIELMKAAVDARQNAYAPYSNFHVGAAVLLGNGAVIIGNNQENACYPAGLCAERVAIFQAAAQYPNERIVAVAISVKSIHHIVEIPAAPCGSCRQSMSEYEFRQKKPIAVLMMGEKGAILKCNAIADLLPLAFNSSYLD